MSFFAALGLRETRRKDSDKGKFTLVFMASAPGAPEIEITHNWPDENGETETFAPPSRRWDTSRSPSTTCTPSARTSNAASSQSSAEGRTNGVRDLTRRHLGELLQKGGALAPASVGVDAKRRVGEFDSKTSARDCKTTDRTTDRTTERTNES